MFPALWAWSLSCWTPREVPWPPLLPLLVSFCLSSFSPSLLSLLFLLLCSLSLSLLLLLASTLASPTRWANASFHPQLLQPISKDWGVDCLGLFVSQGGKERRDRTQLIIYRSVAPEDSWAGGAFENPQQTCESSIDMMDRLRSQSGSVERRRKGSSREHPHLGNGKGKKKKRGPSKGDWAGMQNLEENWGRGELQKEDMVSTWKIQGGQKGRLCGPLLTSL